MSTTRNWTVVPSYHQCEGFDQTFAIDDADNKRAPYIADYLTQENAQRIVDCIQEFEGIEIVKGFMANNELAIRNYQFTIDQLKQNQLNMLQVIEEKLKEPFPFGGHKEIRELFELIEAMKSKVETSIEKEGVES